jgi:uncharacterized protein YvpB
MKRNNSIHPVSKFSLAALLLGVALTLSALAFDQLSITKAAANSTAEVQASATQTPLPQVSPTATGPAQSTVAVSTPSPTPSPTATAPTATATATATNTNAATDTPSPTATSTRTVIPASTAQASTASAPTATSQPSQTPTKAIISGFPSLTQSYSLSCEYAAAAAVTLYWGNFVSENVFLSQVPSSPNPHLGFRGDINAAFGGINNYGVYAEALVPVLQSQGYNAVTFYGGVDRLKANIAAGNPVVVWYTTGKYVQRTPVTATYNGASFTLVAGEHAVVIYGYDSGGVYIMDVASGSYAYTEWNSFLTRWSYLDQMALVITPK